MTITFIWTLNIPGKNTEISEANWKHAGEICLNYGRKDLFQGNDNHQKGQ
jgi:hypothetical protein